VTASPSHTCHGEAEGLLAERLSRRHHPKTHEDHQGKTAGKEAHHRGRKPTAPLYSSWRPIVNAEAKHVCGNKGGLGPREKGRFDFDDEGSFSVPFSQVHKETQFFHSDFAHSDYEVAKGSAVSWETPGFGENHLLQKGSVGVHLWLSTNADQTDCSATLSLVSGANVTALCTGSANTAERAKDEHPTKLPGNDMMRSSMSGGFAVLLSLELELGKDVKLAAGDKLRLDVSGGDARNSNKAGVNHRIWHNPKWQSAVEVRADGAMELKWAPASA